jgi:hypothetical protein
MGFSFYPNHEHKCPNISHCPHLGGAALGTLVLLANEQELSRRALHSAIDAERARGDRLFAEDQRLARLMTVAETEKRHGHRPSDIYYRLFTQSPGRVLRRLYDDS